MLHSPGKLYHCNEIFILTPDQYAYIIDYINNKEKINEIQKLSRSSIECIDFS